MKPELRSKKLSAALASLTQIATSTADDHEIAQTFTRLCTDMVSADACRLWLLEDTREKLLLRATFGMKPDVQLDKLAITAKGEGLTSWVVKNQKPILLKSSDELKSSFAWKGKLDAPLYLKEHSVHSFCAVPLKLEEEVFGVLSVDRTKKKGPFSQDDMDSLQILAERYAILFRHGPPTKGSELLIELDVPDSVSDEKLLAEVGRLATLSDDLHRAYGGHGLKVSRLEIYEEVLEGATNG